MCLACWLAVLACSSKSIVQYRGGGLRAKQRGELKMNYEELNEEERKAEEEREWRERVLGGVTEKYMRRI